MYVHKDRDAASAPDIVGMGALNVDHIVTIAQLGSQAKERVIESSSRFEWNRENRVEKREILDALDRLHDGPWEVSAQLGGSAWLTIRTLAEMASGIRLGYVGVMGERLPLHLSFVRAMETLDVDHTWVDVREGEESGICLSYAEDSDRALEIYPGANVRMRDHLRSHREAIAAYLASARFAHVTSFLDDETPSEVARVLELAKRTNPALRVSLDPGFAWASDVTLDVRQIYAQTDLLFLNYREFKVLGRYAFGESDEKIAAKVLDLCAPGCLVFVAKRYDTVEVFDRPDRVVRPRSYSSRRFAPVTELADATGAGDVFAAAALATLASDEIKVNLGASLGRGMARHKIVARAGSAYLPPDLSRGIWHRGWSRPADGLPARVLLVHDSPDEAAALRSFIERHCGIPVRVFTPSSADRDVGSDADFLAELGHACFGICLMAENLAHGALDPTSYQRMVYRMGLMHGRYGFDRVAVVSESGQGMFSNISGIIRLTYARGRADTTFHDLKRMLEREGLLGRGGADGDGWN